MKRTILFIATVVACCVCLMAQDSETVAVDSMGSPKKMSLLKRIIHYVSNNDTTVNNKPFRWFVMGGPHYSNDAKFGIALYGLVSFRLNGCDPSMQSSTAWTGVDVSTAGFWKVSASSKIMFPEDKMRMNLDFEYGYSPCHFWGMGYDYCNQDSNESKLHQHQALINSDVLFKIRPALYAGPSVQFGYYNSGEITGKPELLEGQKNKIYDVGVGFTLQYDSRDVITDASRGLYISLRQLFNPKFLGNTYGFSSTDFQACYYHRAWKGAVIAGEARAKFHGGSPSWASMSQLGGVSNMRGYYQGRYRDKHAYSFQVELRQHIWKSSGAVVWVGGGNVFHDWDSFKSQFLPNYGLGYRFAVRPHLNLRLDYGFGKRGQNAFVMSVYEAF